MESISAFSRLGPANLLWPMGHSKHDTGRVLKNMWTLGLVYILLEILSPWECTCARLLGNESHMAITLNDIKLTTTHASSLPHKTNHLPTAKHPSQHSRDSTDSENYNKCFLFKATNFQSGLLHILRKSLQYSSQIILRACLKNWIILRSPTCISRFTSFRAIAFC